MAPSVPMVAITIFSAMKRLFKLDKVTGMASVELWVVMSTLLLVVRFLLDSVGVRDYSNKFMLATVQVLALLNFNMVQYTVGQMQPSGPRVVNDYFQVWAVLLVTLQYSVKVGRPYITSKQIPLLDLMSSLWTGQLLRVQTVPTLRIPLWLIWTFNAARIVSYFFSFEKADEANQENTGLVADYMRYEHMLPAGNNFVRADPLTMTGYNYLVHGEDKVSREILEQEWEAGPFLEEERRIGSDKYRVVLNLEHKELITLEKIWTVHGGDRLLGTAADPANRLKDVCLSFALHKMLRRRFHNLPIHEASPAVREKMTRLVFQYILQDVDNYERAFRVTEVELCFLRDSFYSRHASTFANGFPFLRMLLSLLLIVAVGYIAYPVRSIPHRMDPADKNRITHGVFVTRFIIGLIVAKELWEMYIYALAPWTKVQVICKYVKHQYLRRPLVEKAMKLVFCLIRSGKWNRQIGQFNLLISCRRRIVKKTSIKLRAEVQKAILDSFKGLQQQQDMKRLDSYLSNAFVSNQSLLSKFARKDQELEADTHKILAWHIATCLCEINLLSDAAKRKKTSWLRSGPLIKESRVHRDVWKHYVTAVSLSNYCAYLLTEELVPDNGLVATRVFNEVRLEARWAIFGRRRSRTLQDIFDRLEMIVGNPANMSGNEEREEEHLGNDAGNIAAEEQVIQGEEIQEDIEGGNNNEDNFVVNNAPHDDEEPDQGAPMSGGDGFDNTILKIGSEFGMQLIKAYEERGQADLWRDLETFWTGFLLHLAASTRAAKHKNHLARNGELITHLWALLSHAGYLGNARHAEDILDPKDLLNDPSLA
ncbi:unnamed protein product [Urochloa decumbens]|uniref:DUF4220 domain-containing protein n=1 Tax=Urochloa decumbens TaxID=240449 RepID=A0ABC9APU0_9POAL